MSQAANKTTNKTTTKFLTLPQDGMTYLKSIENAIPTAQTEEDELGNIKYSNASLDKYVTPLLECLKLEVGSTLDLIASANLGQGQGYTAWKMTHSTPIVNATGPEHIIPINILDNTKPALRPGGFLQPGKYVYHDGPVDLIPSLNCLFIGKPDQSSNG